MKIGYNEATARDCSDFWRDLTLCEKAGFEVFEPRVDMLEKFLASGRGIEEVRDFFRSSPMEPGAMNAFYTYQELFGKKDDSSRQDAALAEFRRGCEMTAAIGSCDYVVVVPLGTEGYMTPYAGDTETVFDDMVRITERLSDVAADYGVRVALEPVGARKSSVRTAQAAYDIVLASGRKNAGLTIDAANLYVYEKMCDFSGLEKMNPERIFTAHINDYDDVPVDDFTAADRCFCGYGVLPVDGFLSSLEKCGYDGCVAAETFRPEYWAKSPEWVISTAYETTKKAMERYI